MIKKEIIIQKIEAAIANGNMGIVVELPKGESKTIHYANVGEMKKVLASLKSGNEGA